MIESNPHAASNGKSVRFSGVDEEYNFGNGLRRSIINLERSEEHNSDLDSWQSVEEQPEEIPKPYARNSSLGALPISALPQYESILSQSAVGKSKLRNRSHGVFDGRLKKVKNDSVASRTIVVIPENASRVSSEEVSVQPDPESSS